jgi:DNA polymerase
MNKIALLEDLAGEIRVCPKCRLAETRINAVPGEGNQNARIMFVGEAPGENEDKQGRPFVGAAGKVLGKLLDQAGIDREDVFITNTVKCRPPENRVPLADEIEACNDWLNAQIAVIGPKIICTLGSPALKTLLGPDLKISTARCKVFRKSGILFIPLYHPAAALHRPPLLETLQNDILHLKELINRDIREDEITDLSPRAIQAREPSTRTAKKADKKESNTDGSKAAPSLF